MLSGLAATAVAGGVRIRALAAVGPHVARAVAWRPLLAGAALGLGLLVLANIDPTGMLTRPGGVAVLVQAGFVPLVCGLAFTVEDGLRPLSAALPVPGWWGDVARLALVLPVVALTAAGQLMIAAHIPYATVVPSAFAAELCGWCAVTLLAAGCVARGRWRGAGGAAAAPASVAVLGALAVLPLGLMPLSPDMPAGAWAHLRHVWLAASTVAVAAFCWTRRDSWSRLHVSPRRDPIQGRGTSGGVQLQP